MATALRTLEQACTPRQSVFDSVRRDTVYDLADLNNIDPRRFFDENYVTQGMEQLLTGGVQGLDGTSASAAGAFLLSQSMGGGRRTTRSRSGYWHGIRRCAPR
ncbi:MAG: hypothetical protein R3A46_05810 [Thermomicrobiales bacterium]